VDRLAKRGFSGGFDPSGHRNSALDGLTLEDLGDPQLSNNPNDAVFQPGAMLTPDAERGSNTYTARRRFDLEDTGDF
jgi:hypothetical protein